VPFDEDGEFLVARTTNIKNGNLALAEAKYTNKEGYDEWTRRGKPLEGDVLFTREAPAGEACVVPKTPILCLGQRVVLFRLNHSLVEPSFCINSIYGGPASEYIKLLSFGSTVPHFNMADIKNIPILHPSISEQQAIVNYIDDETSNLDDATSKAEKQIKLLQEYRTALISEAVTGKIDLREAI
jgi:type I restriction enzyme S subunit